MKFKEQIIECRILYCKIKEYKRKTIASYNNGYANPYYDTGWDTRWKYTYYNPYDFYQKLQQFNTLARACAKLTYWI
jgi:hypothetical protein